MNVHEVGYIKRLEEGWRANVQATPPQWTRSNSFLRIEEAEPMLSEEVDIWQAVHPGVPMTFQGLLDQCLEQLNEREVNG